MSVLWWRRWKREAGLMPSNIAGKGGRGTSRMQTQLNSIYIYMYVCVCLFVCVIDLTLCVLVFQYVQTMSIKGKHVLGRLSVVGSGDDGRKALCLNACMHAYT